MASVEKKGDGKWLVRWRDPDGGQRTRTCPDAATAKALRLEVERTAALGRRWEPADARVLPALLELGTDPETGETVATGGLVGDFLKARRARLSPGTRRHYDRALRQFLVWLANQNPRRRRLTVDLLSRDALEGWFGDLVDDRLPDLATAKAAHAAAKARAKELGAAPPELGDYRLDISTARLYITAVWSAWEWAYDSDLYGEDTARPRRPDLPVAPSTPAAAPTWAQMDAAIGAAHHLSVTTRTSHERLGWAWRARLFTLLRFTGLRVDEQAMRLQWSDVDLDQGRLLIRGELGKSKQERAGREVPLSPYLVELMAGWGTREGYLIAPHLAVRTSHPTFATEIWKAAVVGRGKRVPVAVPARVWGATPGRSKGQPQHAFRKGFKTGLSELGVATHVRDFLVGHHRGIDEHYLDTWTQAVDAVGKVPPLSEDAAAPEAGGAEVIALPGRG